MDVFLTGATGFLGRAVLDRFVSDGYSVTALVSSADDASSVRAAGGTPFLGDEEETRTLSDAILGSDGVIHLATSAREDPDFIDAVLPALESSDKPFIYTGNLWTYGSNNDITETSAQHPPGAVTWLVDAQKRLLPEEGVRISIVAPAVVYGHGQGIPRTITDAVDTSGAQPFLPLIGDGTQHWATVHVEDLADLYLRVFEKEGHTNEVYIAATEAAPTVAELAEAAAHAHGISGGVRSESVEETSERLGAGMAHVLLLDQHAHADKAREELGWEPTRASLADELRAGYTSIADDPLWS